MSLPESLRVKPDYSRNTSNRNTSIINTSIINTSNRNTSPNSGSLVYVPRKETALESETLFTIYGLNGREEVDYADELFGLAENNKYKGEYNKYYNYLFVYFSITKNGTEYNLSVMNIYFK
jgi:hypothetical protein